MKMRQNHFKPLFFCFMLIFAIVLAKEDQGSSSSSKTHMSVSDKYSKSVNAQSTTDVADQNTSEFINEKTDQKANANAGSNDNKSKYSNLINSQFDGILLVANEQTTCAVVLANEAYGYVAATCVVDSNTKQPMDKAQLGVAFYGPEISTSFAVSKVTVHPSFDMKTLANNIAVLEIHQQGTMTKRTNNNNNKDSPKMSQISDSITNWDYLSYIRRSMASVSKHIWAPVQVKEGPVNNADSVCNAGSSIYAANTDAFICSNLAAPALQSADTSCNIPLAMVYGTLKSTTAAPLAIYSHSAVFGSGICSANAQRHYFTLLGNYLAWGASTAAQTQTGPTKSTSNSNSVDPTSDNSSSDQVDDPNGTEGIESTPNIVNVVVKAGNAEYAMQSPSQGSEQISTFSGNLYTLITSKSQHQSEGTGAPSISPTTTVTVHITSTIIVVGASPSPTMGGGTEGNSNTPPTEGATATGSTVTGNSTGAGTSPTEQSATSCSEPGSALPSTTPNIVTVDSVDTNIGASNQSVGSSNSNSVNSNTANSQQNTAASDNSSSSSSDSSGSNKSSESGTNSYDSDGDGNSDSDSDGESDSDINSTPNETGQSNNEAKTTSMSTGAKVAIVMVILLSLCAIGGAYWYFKKYRPRKMAMAREHGE